jgi:hypothetical protein
MGLSEIGHSKRQDYGHSRPVGGSEPPRHKGHAAPVTNATLHFESYLEEKVKMELERDVLVPPSEEGPLIEKELVATIRESDAPGSRCRDGPD